MDFAHRQRNPAKHLLGISFVVILHLVLAYALISGLARKVVGVIQKPLVTKIIEEVKPPPPPEIPPPPPKMDVPPPPSFIPPPEVQVTPPPMPQNAITTTTTVKPENAQIRPTEQVLTEPSSPEPSATPVAPVEKPVLSVSGLCSNAQDVASSFTTRFDRLAARLDIPGGSKIDISVELVIGTAGEIKAVKVLRSSSYRELDNLTMNLVRHFTCRGQSSEVTVPYRVVFTTQE